MIASGVVTPEKLLLTHSVSIRAHLRGCSGESLRGAFTCQSPALPNQLSFRKRGLGIRNLLVKIFRGDSMSSQGWEPLG